MQFEKGIKLLWIDLEMTGLNVEKEVIIEVAALVTDKNFQVIDQFESVVKQPQEFLDRMDDWNKKHHSESGLTAKIPFGMPSEKVEGALISLVEKNFANDASAESKSRPILAGNSIAQDRLFISKYWKNLDRLLHYRMLDVSSWKIVMNEFYGKKYEKKGTHRAVEDIKESIEELKFYLNFMR